jgi:hypothetical protein
LSPAESLRPSDGLKSEPSPTKKLQKLIPAWIWWVTRRHGLPKSRSLAWAQATKSFHGAAIIIHANDPTIVMSLDELLPLAEEYGGLWTLDMPARLRIHLRLSTASARILTSHTFWMGWDRTGGRLDQQVVKGC